MLFPKNNTGKKVYFITGGGTGGHIYPALAVALELKDNDVYFIGKKDNLEHKLAIENNLKFLNVNAYPMPRKISFSLFLWGIKTLFSGIKAYFYILKYKPHAIFATGGYVSAPSLIGAFLSNTPYMLHDADIHPGIVTRRFAPRAKFVSVAFEKAKENLHSHNIKINGNPIRKSFAGMEKKENKNPVILAIGGSQGASTINKAIMGCAYDLIDKYNVEIILQTGNKKFDEIRLNYPQKKGLTILPYLDDISSFMRKADIIVSRSGSLSISEICASSLAPILVPYPYASANHQRLNAKSLENDNACIYLEDSDCTSENLKLILEDLINHPQKIKTLSKNAAKHSKPEALKNIIEQFKSI